MTTYTTRAVCHLALAATVLLAPLAARPSLASDAFRQVRPVDARVAHLLRKGLRRSRTIGLLLDELARTNVVVYIRTTTRQPDDLAGSTAFIGSGSDGRRWLMVTLYGDAGWTTLEGAEDRQLITLGHELRHVLEVAKDPRITTVDAFFDFYRENGDLWQEARVDTHEARAAGSRVARELSYSPH
jgi:hypothetical protein